MGSLQASCKDAVHLCPDIIVLTNMKMLLAVETQTNLA